MMKHHERAATKVCNICGEEQPDTEFGRYRKNGKAYVRRFCRSCQRARDRKYYEAGPEREKAKRKRMYAKHKEKRIAYSRQYRKENPNKVKQAVQDWRERNPGESSMRTRLKECRVPPWASLSKMRDIYNMSSRLSQITGIQYHVDHIVPVRGKDVSGLHWEGNLLVMPAFLNRRKLNKTDWMIWSALPTKAAAD